MAFRTLSLSLVMLLALGLFLALPWLFAATSQSGFYGVPVRAEAPELIHNGRDLLVDHDSPASIVFFGYKGCADACPRQLVNTMKLQKRMAGHDLRFLFVSLAPERVSAQELDRWLESMGDGFMGFRPDSAREARDLVRAFGGRSTNSGAERQRRFSHTANLHVVTPDGVRRLIYTGVALDLDRVEQDLERLIASQ